MAPYAAVQPAVNRPGVGIAVALVGLLMVLLSLVSLPWVKAPDGGEDAKLSDWSDIPEEAAEQGDVEFVSVYADGLWIFVLVGLTFVVVTSTLWVPQSQGGRIALGILSVGLLGLLHLADKRGTWAHRVCGAVATLFYAFIHLIAVVDVFTFEDESAGLDAGTGIWVGLIGFLVVLVGCALGTRTDKQAPQPTPYTPAYR